MITEGVVEGVPEVTVLVRERVPIRGRPAPLAAAGQQRGEPFDG